MRDTRTRKTTASKRTESYVQVKKSIGVVSVVFISGHRKSLAEAADAADFIVDTSSEFPYPSRDALIVEDKIIEKDSLWDLRELLSKDDRRFSSFQWIQKFRQSYCLSVPLDVRSVQEVIKNAEEAFAIARGDEASLADPQNTMR